MPDYAKIAKDARIKVLELIYKAQASHAGSNFSIIDVLTVLFEHIDIKKDEAVLSAGWKAASWFYFLWRKGVITEEELNSFCMPGSPLIGLVEPIMGKWGLRFGGGSIALGTAGSVGFALAKKIKKEQGTIYAIESDGAVACGIIYESALIARQHKLNNLVLILDVNSWQAMGKTEDILNIEPLDKMWGSLGWNWVRIDGHNFNELHKLFTKGIPFLQKTDSRPIVVIVDTTKGKGVSYMENNNLWHYWHLDKEHYEKALGELNA